jgi:hypothetical protein
LLRLLSGFHGRLFKEVDAFRPLPVHGNNAQSQHVFHAVRTSALSGEFHSFLYDRAMRGFDVNRFQING